MRLLVVSNGVVENVISAPEGFTVEGKTVAQHPSAQIGWLYDGGTFTPPPAPACTQTDVIAERETRLAAGFDYDFGDARGIHHIATTADDMKKWQEVTDSANALINLGQGTQTITIATQTGPVDVTAMEWQAILVAAAQFRQPIYQASFALMAMDPILDDFATHPIWDA